VILQFLCQQRELL